MGIRYTNAVFLVLSASVPVLLGQAAAAQQRGGPGLVGPGAVQGYVLDEAGKAVVGASVSISQALPAGVARTAAPPVITGPQITTSVTDAKGVFLAALPAGDYVACANAAAPGLLNPCHWAASAPVFSVTAGQSTVTPNIVMAKGAVVPI